MSSQLLSIARNSFAIVVHNRVVYLLVFLVVLLVGLTAVPFLLMQAAEQAGETEMVGAMQQDMALMSFGLWSTATYLLAIFLGATAISAEVRAGTIVSVLARPVERWHFLAGKWLGAQGFLVLFLGAGTLVTVFILQLLAVEPAAVFWLGVARSFVVAAIFAGSALLLGVVSSPVFAGGVRLLASLLSSATAPLTSHESTWVQAPALFIHLVVPAGMPDDLLEQGFTSYPLQPAYGLYAQVMLENVLYAGVLLLLACWAFSRREVAAR